MDANISVAKGGAVERYTVRNGYDYATIVIVEWPPRQDSHGPIYGGEILVNSSFGSYCNSWSHCGQPFKLFLAGLDFGYFMTKCLGLAADEYDGEGTLRAVKKRIIAERRYGNFDRFDARTAWDALDDYEIEHSEYGLRDATGCYEIGEALGPEWYELIRKRPTAQSRGFWRDIWPHFVAAVRAE